MASVLDHIGIVGPDLAALEADFARLGFLVAPRCELVALDAAGAATPLGQHNSHLVFDDTYVELTAVHGDLSAHHLRDAIARYWGLHIIVMRTQDASAEQARLARQGSAVPPPALAARHVAYPGGAGLARFRWFRVPETEFPEAFLCAVEHLDPGLVFDAQLNAHPNGAHALHSVTVMTDRPEAAAKRLAAIVEAAPQTVGNGIRVPASPPCIEFMNAKALADRFGGISPPAPPWLAAFSVTCRDLDRAGRYLRDGGVGLHQAADRIWTPPEAGGGVIVEFIGA